MKKSAWLLGTSLILGLGIVVGQINAQASQKVVVNTNVWEYKTVRTNAVGGSYTRIGSQYSSTGSEATSVEPRQIELGYLGLQGWELVSTYLELETAFPNFAKGDTVEGLKSNVRTQALVMIFKRKSTPEAAQAKIEEYTIQIKAEEKRIKEYENKARDQIKSEKAEADRKQAENTRNAEIESKNSFDLDKENAALWEKHKAESILDGVVLDTGQGNGTKILAMGPKSKLKRLGEVLAIKLASEPEFRLIKKYGDIKSALATNTGKAVLVRWLYLGITYETTVTIEK